MLSLNGKEINLTQFPDGTSSFRFDTDGLERDLDRYSYPLIKWRYDGDHECIILWYLVKQIRSIAGPDKRIQLYMPYIPNARMDRVKNNDEVFTLKWFADFINMLNFSRITVLDPHSNVAPALINNIYIIQPDVYIKATIDAINDNNLLICYPDEGASKRYSELLSVEYISAIKHRDWRTGKIERLELTAPEKAKGRNILIVDDICSRGGTFTHTAMALKEAGARDIFLYVSHCENTIFKGSVFNDGLICHVFTTNSIYRGEHENVTAFQS